jgi:hypothetical protein
MNKKQDREGLVEKSKGDNSNLPLTEGEESLAQNSLVTNAGNVKFAPLSKPQQLLAKVS